MDPIIVISQLALSDQQLASLQQVSARLRIHQYPAATLADVSADIRQQVKIMFWHGALMRETRHFPNLKWFQVGSAGVDFLMDTALWESDVTITNTSGIHAVPIAERILAMMLAFRARLPDLWRNKQSNHWPDDRWDTFSSPELRGSTIGIVGYGAIGGEVARQAQALGMRVLALSRSGQRQALKGYLESGTGDPYNLIPEQLYPAADLLDMLPQCDHVVMLAPLTAETQHMIGSEALAVMKPTAYIYNYGRGGLIDEAALIAALQNGRLAGAGLDVFDEEPLPVDSPLWELPNVIISPHVGGMTAIYNDRATNVFAENLRRYVRGEPLFNVISRDLGY